MLLKQICSISLLTLALFATGCSTLPVNYVPSASMRGNGNIKVGKFKYIPADKGQVKPAEFQKVGAAIGSISISEPVVDLMRSALRKELIASGFSVEPDAPITIEGDIHRFLYDWIGLLEVDFYLDIDFRVIKNGQVVLTYKANSHQKAPKTMAQDTEAIKAAISRCIDDLFLEARSKKIF
jgi:uncharacterized lipoprotein YajG